MSGQIERHHLWQMGEGYGARCERHFTEGVTHVISGHPNSNTVRRARAEGKHVVSVDWLEESSRRWARVRARVRARARARARARVRVRVRVRLGFGSG